MIYLLFIATLYFSPSTIRIAPPFLQNAILAVIRIMKMLHSINAELLRHRLGSSNALHKLLS